MSLDLTDEQVAFAESVRASAHDRLGQSALRRADEPGYAWDAARLLADQHLLGLTIAEDGGQGASLMEAVIAIQEVARVCPKSGDVIQASNFGAIRTFAEYASPELKERYLPDLLAGRSLLALAMSEPEAGSAVTDLKTSAVADGDAYLLNGSKVFSTHSPDASAFLVYTWTGSPRAAGSRSQAPSGSRTRWWSRRCSPGLWMSWKPARLRSPLSFARCRTAGRRCRRASWPGPWPCCRTSASSTPTG